MPIRNTTINRTLNGLNPLSYMGDNPTTPPNFYSIGRNPTVNDWQDFMLCDLWLNTVNENVYVLVSLNNNQAKWVLLTNGVGPILAIANDVGAVLPANGLINLFATPNAGKTVSFVGFGNTINLHTTDNLGNTSVGAGSGASIVAGVSNTFFGTSAGTLCTGNSNTLIGWGCGQNITTGSANTGLGSGALAGLVTGLMTGINNVGIGNGAGSAYTGAESNNIILGSAVPGVVGESNVLRIGESTGSGVHQINKAFIAGIAGITTVVADAVPVLISASTGQLGTISSSARFKENIIDMLSHSELIMKLRPVIFNYISDSLKNTAVGLIAEEVAEVFPDLTVYKDGQPETVKYHDLPVLLLNELQKLTKRVETLESK